MDQKKIRNFAIISHIDHGKSTLADRFLELTGSVEARKMREQFLDAMDLERERGITIKMQPVRMRYGDYILNLIDTPGHIDFAYEVSRALAAVEGVILLVDATRGAQAQTLANFKIARDLGLVIIPAINKIDSPQADINKAEGEIEDLLLGYNYAPDYIYRISAKTGESVEDLLKAVIEKIPSPSTPGHSSFRALVFDSHYNTHKGIIVHLRAIEGQVRKEERILFNASGLEAGILELGHFTPALLPYHKLEAGDIGYIATGLKRADKIKAGDTITTLGFNPLPGYQEPRPMVFAGVFPKEGSDYEALQNAIFQLKLNDASLYSEPDYSEALGRGIKCGFLGMLHMEIILERLRREFNMETVITNPSVAYKITLKDGRENDVFTPSKLPDPSGITQSKEPFVALEILTPLQYLSGVMSVLKNMRGEYCGTNALGRDLLQINYKAPLQETITNFYDRLKSVSRGFASVAYKPAGFHETDVVKMDILLAGEKIEALAQIVPRSQAQKNGREIVKRLREVIPAEQFAVAIQAAVGGKIIARETKPAMRKDVTAPLYGGDFTRKRKLLEKQKKGKKRLQSKGRVHLDSGILVKLFKS